MGKLVNHRAALLRLNIGQLFRNSVMSKALRGEIIGACLLFAESSRGRFASLSVKSFKFSCLLSYHNFLSNITNMFAYRINLLSACSNYAAINANIGAQDVSGCRRSRNRGHASSDGGERGERVDSIGVVGESVARTETDAKTVGATVDASLPTGG